MVPLNNSLAKRIAEATTTVFGESALSSRVVQYCHQFEKDLENIYQGRGIRALLIAIVGAKGQGKTWIAKQLIRNETVRQQLKSGDLQADATTRLVWIGPVAPDALDSSNEIYYSCPVSDMVDLGQPFVLLDTPGMTDADQRAAKLAHESLSLAPIKLLAIARDQMRAAINLSVAQQIDGSICVPVITSVDPDQAEQSELQSDLRNLRDQLKLMAPHSQITTEILVPDFEVTGNESAAGTQLKAQLLDLLSELGITQSTLSTATELRLKSAAQRLKTEVGQLIRQELPQLSEAVSQLHQETEQLPARVLASLLGSQSVLETGVRMRLRTRMTSDTSVLWFPYRTVMSVLNLTHGAWDRLVLAMTGSVPSMFGALSTWARNVRTGQTFATEVNDGIRQRTQQQIEDRLRPKCEQFRRAVQKLRSREDRVALVPLPELSVKLLGIDEFQMRSRDIFELTLDKYAITRWHVQLLALLGTVLFWTLMAAPIVVLYRDYFGAVWSVWSGVETDLERFPSPRAGLFLTSLCLSVLPLMVFCMLVLTLALRRSKMVAIAGEIAQMHQKEIDQMHQSQQVRIQYDEELLEQAEFLLSINR
ncbi:MAG TPA: hypothetical protein DCF63_08075 [Planctomycetaceae bacterium]|nr:hypothetical protein [Planctomycetaceae bacterium]